MQTKASSWKSKRQSHVQNVGNASGTEQLRTSHYEEIFACVLGVRNAELANIPLEAVIRALLHWGQDEGRKGQQL